MYTEQELLKIWRDNPEKGMVLLMEKYEKLIWNICARRLENPEDIKECVNETFADFFVNHQNFDEEKSNLKNYLCMIADRKAIDIYRKNQRRENFLNEEAEKIKEKKELDEITNQEIERLEAALEQLPETDRKILEMKYYDEMSYEEIGKKLDMSVDSVRKRGQRSKKKLLCILLVGLLIATLIACAVAVYKKYYYSDEYGYIWTDDTIYELVNKGEYLDTEYLRYKVKKGIYQNGHLKLALEIEYLGEDEVITSENRKRIEEELSVMLKKDIKLDVLDYLESNVQKGTKYMNFFVSFGLADLDLYIRGEEGVHYNVKVSPSFNLTSENVLGMTETKEDNSFCVWLGHKDQGEVKLEFSVLTQEEYMEEEKTELFNGTVLTLGPAMAGKQFTVIDLFKEKDIGLEYQLTPFLLHSAYGLGKRERENAILTDEQGAFYHSMRISYNGEEERERFELYFPVVPEGDYTLTLPYLCMSKEENSQTVTLDLPTGEENYKTCDETVLFADGNGFHIVGIERTEYIENIVNVNPDGSLESVIELKQWTYALDYEAISMEGELEFCTALIQTVNTEYVKGIDEKERPKVTINQTANIESVEIYFTNPVYIWDQELKWNVLIRESE